MSYLKAVAFGLPIFLISGVLAALGGSYYVNPDRFSYDSSLGFSGTSLWHPLLLATNLAKEGMMEHLLAVGFDVNAKNAAGSTALHFSTANGQAWATEILVKGGADPMARDANGHTPIMLVRQRYSEPILSGPRKAAALLINASICDNDIFEADHTQWVCTPDDVEAFYMFEFWNRTEIPLETRFKLYTQLQQRAWEEDHPQAWLWSDLIAIITLELYPKDQRPANQHIQDGIAASPVYKRWTSSQQNLLRIGRENGTFNAEGKDLRVEIVDDEIPIIRFPNFYSDDECERIIELATPRLEESTVDLNNPRKDDKVRISETAWLAMEDRDPQLMELARRVDAVVGVPVQNQQQPQVVKYGVGGFYTEHYDAQEFFNNIYKKGRRGLTRGERINTLIIYLTDVEEGGSTYFPKKNMHVYPKKGDAVLFYNLNHDGTLNKLSKHRGSPVVEGEKWIVNKWSVEKRERGM